MNPNAIENEEDDDASEATSDNNVQDEDEDNADSAAAEAAGDLVAGLGECILKGSFFHSSYFLFIVLSRLHFYFFPRPVCDQR